MSTILMPEELEERIREIVRDELRKSETARRPPWNFDRMDAARRRIDDHLPKTGARRDQVEGCSDKQSDETPASLTGEKCETT